MASYEFPPDDAGPILHLYDQAVLVVADIEHDTIVGADAGVAVLRLDLLG